MATLVSPRRRRRASPASDPTSLDRFVNQRLAAMETARMEAEEALMMADEMAPPPGEMSPMVEPPAPQMATAAVGPDERTVGAPAPLSDEEIDGLRTEPMIGLILALRQYVEQRSYDRAHQQALDDGFEEDEARLIADTVRYYAWRPFNEFDRRVYNESDAPTRGDKADESNKALLKWFHDGDAPEFDSERYDKAVEEARERQRERERRSDDDDEEFF